MLCLISGINSYSHFEVGVCEVIGVVSAMFLLPVLAAGASEYDFSAFFDVSARPCARSSTADAQSAISGNPLRPRIRLHAFK